jgi:hypothetical protein
MNQFLVNKKIDETTDWLIAKRDELEKQLGELYELEGVDVDETFDSGDLPSLDERISAQNHRLSLIIQEGILIFLFI